MLVGMVERLGGSVTDTWDDDPRTIPVDLSLGDCAPLLPVCDPYSVARRHLIRLLPIVMDLTRRVVPDVEAVAVGR